jgi:protein-S-isoprenylcysteine O-methyltransferase Ste14
MKNGNSAPAGCAASAILLLVAAFFTLVSMILLLWFGAVIWNYFNALTWPQASCKIVSASLESSAHQSRRGGPWTDYKANIKYRFQFGGREFDTDSYAFSASGDGSRDSAERILKQYPVNSQVVCYVNPSRPEAILSRGNFPWVPLVVVGFCGLLLLLILLGLWAWLRSGAPREGEKNRNLTPIFKDQ